MSWVKRTDTQETSKFWSHVQSVAERVRTSEIYANNRVPKDGLSGPTEHRCDAQEEPPAPRPRQVSNQP
jgi:hypothetical protein